MLVKLTKEEMAKIKDFCTTLSSKRRQRDIVNNDTGNHRIIRELTGKAGEYAAWKVTKIGSVDFEIYAAADVKKKCLGDLDEHTHVKTCHAKYKDTRYDGWLVGILEKWIDNPHEDDKIILAYGDEGGTVEIAGYILAKEVVGMYKLPINRKLEHKVALYRKDIDSYIRDIKEIING